MQRELKSTRSTRRPAWRRAVRLFLGVVLLLEVVLQIARPAALDNIRNRTFFVRRADIGYTTMQSQNFDPVTRRPLMVYDSMLFWRMLPRQAGRYWRTADVVTNELGLRDEPLPAAKARDERRILFLGDSVTFGLGVDAEDRFSSFVGDALSARNDAVTWRSINAGVVGYTSTLGLTLLERLWEKIEPDVVVFTFGVNDTSFRRQTDLEFRDTTRSLYARTHELARRSQLLCALDGLQAYARRGFNTLRTGERHAVATFLYYPSQPIHTDKVPRVPTSVFLDNFAAAHRLCQERGALFIAVDQFVSPDLAGPGKDGAYFERLADRFPVLETWASNEGVPFVAAAAELARSGLPDDELLLDFCHPTPTGHALIAVAVSEVLEDSEALHDGNPAAR